MAGLLILFDLDGTLLLGDGGKHGEAMLSSLNKLHALDLTMESLVAIEPWGKTDLLIRRQLLEQAGVSDKATIADSGAWITATSQAFLSASSESWQARESIGGALPRLRQEGMMLTLLTGNLRPVAICKAEKLGLVPFLDFSVGAYGDESEDRNTLVPLARARAGDWARSATVVVGDTPRDIACAQADGVRSIIFSSSLFPASTLKSADAVVETSEEMVELLIKWQHQL